MQNMMRVVAYVAEQTRSASSTISINVCGSGEQKPHFLDVRPVQKRIYSFTISFSIPARGAGGVAFCRTFGF